MADRTFVPLVVTNSSKPTTATVEMPETVFRLEPVSLPTPVTQDDELWALAVTAKYTAHRELHQVRTGGAANSIWIGDKPIDYSASRWLYDLFDKLLRRGLMFTERAIYRLTPEGERALLGGMKARRKPKPDGPLINAITGESQDFGLD
jgi:hypothetical protein